MSERTGVKAFLTLPPHLWGLVRDTAAAFFILVVVGFSFGMLRPETVEPMMRIFIDTVTGAGLYEVTGFPLMAAILANNLLSLLFAIACGLLPFLRLPALEIGVNALLIGIFASYYQRSGLGMAAYIAGTLPHGLTELSALVFACSAGLYLCRVVSGAILGSGSPRAVTQALAECLRVYTHWVVPLLILSAFLEAYVTPLIFNVFL